MTEESAILLTLQFTSFLSIVSMVFILAYLFLEQFDFRIIKEIFCFKHKYQYLGSDWDGEYWSCKKCGRLK